MYWQNPLIATPVIKSAEVYSVAASPSIIWWRVIPYLFSKLARMTEQDAAVKRDVFKSISFVAITFKKQISVAVAIAMDASCHLIAWSSFEDDATGGTKLTINAIAQAAPNTLIFFIIVLGYRVIIFLVSWKGCVFYG